MRGGGGGPTGASEKSRQLLTILWWKSKFPTYTGCPNDHQAQGLFYKHRFQDLPKKPPRNS